jgi:hypothetical protein
MNRKDGGNQQNRIVELSDLSRPQLAGRTFADLTMKRSVRMKLRVKIYTNEDFVGTITLEGGRFSVDPPDSNLLNGILEDPVYLQRNGEMVDVFAQQDPEAFMKGLWKHYKSQGLRASGPENQRRLGW